MTAQITKKVGKNITPERWQKVASKFSYEIKDIIGPTTFPTAFNVGTPCAQLATSDGTKWSVSQKFACYQVVDNKTHKLIPYSKVKAT